MVSDIIKVLISNYKTMESGERSKNPGTMDLSNEEGNFLDQENGGIEAMDDGQKVESTEEGVDALLDELSQQIEVLVESRGCSREERERVIQNVKSLKISINNLGAAGRKETLISNIRQEMIHELGEEYEEKFKRFFKLLSFEEGVLIQALIRDGVADIEHAFDGDLSMEEVYLKLIKEDFISGCKKMAHKITRGIGTRIGGVEVTSENWKIGPRGQWYGFWNKHVESLRGKIEELKK